MGAKPLFFIIAPLPILLCMWRFAPSRWDSGTLAGFGLTVFGLAMLTVARVQLGNSFSVTPQARALVTRGIYSRVRHPVYVFSAVVIAGLVLYFDLSRWLLLLLIPLAIVQGLRARAEERVLEQRFGEEYRQYRAGTWF